MMKALKKGAMACWIVVLAIALLAACGGDSDEAADGDSGLKPFGQSCNVNADCETSLCVVISGVGFCSASCTSDADCETITAGTCCETETNVCLLYDQCNAGDGDDPDGDDPEMCTAGDFRCLGNDVQKCDVAGDWSFYRDCLSDGKVCVDGSCSDSADGDDPDGDDTNCDPGRRRCADDNTVEVCNVAGDGWEIVTECGINELCDQAECRLQGTACTTDEGCAGDLEYCQPNYVGSTDGVCVPNCDTAGGSCPRGWTCDHGVCLPIDGYCRSDNACELDEFCDRLPTSDDGMCKRYCELPGEGCPELYVCIKDTSDLNYGRCILENPECDACAGDYECDAGSYCEIVTGQTQGCCRPQCGASNPCPGTLNCDTDGRCVAGPGPADCGGCPPGYICDPTFNQCVINCPACAENQFCDASTAPNCVAGPCTNPVVCGVLLPQCCFGYSCSAVIYGAVGYCI